MKIDVTKLKEKILEKNLCEYEFLEKIGLNESIYKNKLECENNFFTVKEANDIVKVLNLTSSEAVSIFFPSFVA